ncbi:MAG: single-stranded-DNA-specific exonuclease RecJ [Oscillospiraceae bacterium]|nr:single-stranded-DNA-specific exonuclease RecJ [Oscillospiraceae bacterium]
MIRKRWVLRGGQAENRALAASLSQEEGLPPFAAMMALGRGITPEELPCFLGLAEECLCNPYDLPDMEPAIERIERAFELDERITVFGDYDADGVTATAALYHYLLTRTENVDWALPDRVKDGYGLSMAAIDRLVERGTKLLITVDNGVSALREIAHAKALGITTIVTDHHQIGGTLPECAAVVNPHRDDCELPFKEYTGAGLAFLLICALEGCEPEELLPAYGELVALGTVADVAPLLGDNRVFARAGLAILNESPSVGLAALLRAAKYSRRPLGTSALSFTLGPRINAAGRMGRAEEALELLLCSDEAVAERLAGQLDNYNDDRQRTEQEIARQALAWLELRPLIQCDRVLVFAGEGWHEGVIGIVASRMAERFGKPCILITTNGEAAKGSGRSLPGFHLFEAIHACAQLMQKYGGHELAAGFSLPADCVDQFRLEINQYAAKIDMPFPLLQLDAKLKPARISPALAEELALLEPFGQGNPQPVFALTGLTLVAATPLSENRHLRLTLEQDSARVTVMAFHTCKEDFLFLPGDAMDLAVTVEASEYMGQRGVTLIVKGAKFAALPNEALLRAERLVECALRRELPPALRGDGAPHNHPGAAAPPLHGGEWGDMLPSREDGALIFRLLKKAGTPLPPERFFLNAGLTEAHEMARLWLAAEVLRELGVLETDAQARYCLAPAGEKADWEGSGLLAFLSNH